MLHGCLYDSCHRAENAERNDDIAALLVAHTYLAHAVPIVGNADHILMAGFGGNLSSDSSHFVYVYRFDLCPIEIALPALVFDERTAAVYAIHLQADVYPCAGVGVGVVLFAYHLVEDVHLANEVEELHVVGWRLALDVGSLAAHVLAVGGPAYGLVEQGAAIAGGDGDGGAVLEAKGFEYLRAEIHDAEDDLGARVVVDLLASGGFALHELGEGEVFGDTHSVGRIVGVTVRDGFLC